MKPQAGALPPPAFKNVSSALSLARPAPKLGAGRGLYIKPLTILFDFSKIGNEKVEELYNYPIRILWQRNLKRK